MIWCKKATATNEKFLELAFVDIHTRLRTVRVFRLRDSQSWAKSSILDWLLNLFFDRKFGPLSSNLGKNSDVLLSLLLQSRPIILCLLRMAFISISIWKNRDHKTWTKSWYPDSAGLDGAPSWKRTENWQSLNMTDENELRGPACEDLSQLFCPTFSAICHWVPARRNFKQTAGQRSIE